MNQYVQPFFDYLAASPTAFHAVENFREMLEKAGYRELKEKDPWIVDEGGKYYVTRNGSAIIAFAIPGSGFSSFRIALPRPRRQSTPWRERNGNCWRQAIRA